MNGLSRMPLSSAAPGVSRSTSAAAVLSSLACRRRGLLRSGYWPQYTIGIRARPRPPRGRRDGRSVGGAPWKALGDLRLWRSAALGLELTRPRASVTRPFDRSPTSPACSRRLSARETVRAGRPVAFRRTPGVADPPRAWSARSSSRSAAVSAGSTSDIVDRIVRFSTENRPLWPVLLGGWPILLGRFSIRIGTVANPRTAERPSRSVLARVVSASRTKVPARRSFRWAAPCLARRTKPITWYAKVECAGGAGFQDVRRDGSLGRSRWHQSGLALGDGEPSDQPPCVRCTHHQLQARVRPALLSAGLKAGVHNPCTPRCALLAAGGSRPTSPIREICRVNVLRSGHGRSSVTGADVSDKEEVPGSSPGSPTHEVPGIAHLSR